MLLESAALFGVFLGMIVCGITGFGAIKEGNRIHNANKEAGE